MSDVVLKVENLSKVYRLGEIGTGTISHDLNRWWARVRGKEDPFAKVGVNDRTQKARNGEWVKVLDNINFEVKKGEVLGIIGKNGAGKSTLLKVISQITSPTSGSVKVKGRIASLLEVGTGMHPEMTGKENVYLNGTILGMTRREIDAKFDEIMDFAGCAKYADTPIKRYSSGMKVRLGFAVAAFLEPEILIVDEVLAVGDAEFQRKAIGKMQDISAGEGRTVLFVSHNMGSVQNLCTTGLLLNNGTGIFYSKIHDAVNTYLTSQSKVYHGTVDTKERTDRVGHGMTKITRVAFFDAKSGNSIHKLFSGQDVEIHLNYESESSVKILNHMNLGITFFDSNNTFKTVLNNEMAGYQLKHLPPKGKIICRLRSTPFMYGNLTLTLTLKVNGILEDKIESATSIFVEEGDFYGTGISNSFKREGIYIDHIYKYEEIN